MQAWPMRHSALEFFFDNLAENFVVQGEIVVHLLELGVFFFEFLQLFKLAGIKFVYALDDFRFGMSQFLHGGSFATKGSILTQAELPFV